MTLRDMMMPGMYQGGPQPMQLPQNIGQLMQSYQMAQQMQPTPQPMYPVQQNAPQMGQQQMGQGLMAPAQFPRSGYGHIAYR